MGEVPLDRGRLGRGEEREIAVTATLSRADLQALERIEELPCNRPGQDKSWVLRAAENRRRFFREVRRAAGD
jgi:hypothetical protein